MEHGCCTKGRVVMPKISGLISRSRHFLPIIIIRVPALILVGFVLFEVIAPPFLPDILSYRHESQTFQRNLVIAAIAGALVLLVSAAMYEFYLTRTLKMIMNQKIELETIFNLVPAQIWYKDRTNKILHVNSTVCRDLGMMNDEIEGHSANELFPLYAKQYYEDDLTVLSTGKPIQGILEQMNTATGDRMWLETDKIPVFGTAGDVTGLIALVKDVTNYKLVDAALRESEARFRQIADNIREVFFLYEKEGNTPLYISPSIFTIFGITQEMVQADTTLIERSVYANDLPHLKFVHPVHFYSMPLDEEFRVIRHSDGALRWVRLRSFLIRDAQGEVVRVAGLAEDTTDLRTSLEQAHRQQELLLQADKMASLGILVSGIAHEINNPNNLIMFNSDLVSRMLRHLLPILDTYYDAHTEEHIGGLTYEETRKELSGLLKGISTGSQRIRDIISELREFSRMDAGDLHQEVRLNDVVKSALLIVKNLIVRSTDHFSEQYEDNLPTISGNSQQIEQVIINLLTNACQALPDPGRAIRVRTDVDTENGMVRVIVTDEGDGISEENKKRLFDPFFTTKREHGGTGLGLSVSYKIVQAHGGRLQIESVQGEGTTVTLSLPIATAKEAL
jgi:PAS domain S-box-containing protein